MFIFPWIDPSDSPYSKVEFNADGSYYFPNATENSTNTSSSTSSNISSDEILNFLNNAYSNDAKAIDKANQLQRSMLQDVMDYNSAEAVKSRDFTAQQNEIARRYQTEMSNSAFSRGLQDIKNSGLNPYFALSNGLQASSPSFGSSSSSAASVSVPSSKAQDSMLSSFTSMYNNLVNNAFNVKKLNVDSTVKLVDSFLNFLKPVPTKK